MKTKKELTPEEKLAKAEATTFNRRFGAFVRTIKSEIEKDGLQVTELRLAYLEEHPQARLPKEYFDHATTVKGITQAIREYKEETLGVY